MRQSMNSPALFACLLVLVVTSSATAQNADQAQPPAVFPPLNTEQQAAKQPIIDSIEVSPAARRPNIVLIFADDLGYADIGCFGSIEISTPRWSMFDAKELGIPHPEDLHKVIQERAYSSPIWYDHH